MAGEIPKVPGGENLQQSNRLKMPDVKGAISRGTEAVRSRISSWLDRNKQPIPQEDPAVLLGAIASGKVDSDSQVTGTTKTPELSPLPSGPLGYMESANQDINGNPLYEKLPDENFLEHLQDKSIKKQQEIRPSESMGMGTKLTMMRDLVEKGLNAEEAKLRVVYSLEELVPGLQKAIDTNVMGVPNKAYFSQSSSESLTSRTQEVTNRATGKKVETDGYNAMVGLYQEMPGSEVKLVQYGQDVVAVATYDASPELQIIQVLEPEFPVTEKFARHKEELHAATTLPAPLDEREKKERYVKAKNLIFVDKKHGTMFDFKELVPPDWTFRHVPSTDVRVCMENTPEKFILYSEIAKPEFLIGVLHEWGHAVNNLADPQVFTETKALWDKASDPFEGFKNMSTDEVDRFRVLQPKAERGATAIATQLLRSLKERGFDPGLPVKEFRDQAREALASYDSRFSAGEERVFQRKDRIVKKRVA